MPSSTRVARFPVTATDEERTTLLIRAGRIVSTTRHRAVAADRLATSRMPSRCCATTSTRRSRNLITLRDDATTGRRHAQRNHQRSCPTIDTIDQTPFDVAPFRDSVLALASDLLQKRGLPARRHQPPRHERDRCARRVPPRRAATRHRPQQRKPPRQCSARPSSCLPEFKLSSDRLAEWNNVWTNRANLLTHLTTGTGSHAFPGGRLAARCGAGARASAPSRADDAARRDARCGEAARCSRRCSSRTARTMSWLGLRFPATFPDGTPFVLHEDKLLYSAHCRSGR